MQIKKAFVSIVLLFVYSLGFAHTLIPHCHDAKTEQVSNTENKHHNHNHSQHAENHNHVKHEHKGHEHVNHGDHFDENIYDYFVCVLLEMEHQGQDNEFVHFLPKTIRNNNIAGENVFSDHAAVLVQPLNSPNYHAIQRKETSLYSKAYFSPLIYNNPLRGPPNV